MKIILSRKGFDSKYGRQASPILPDGTLLSMPIPFDGETVRFTDLKYNGESYYKILKDLKPNNKQIEIDTPCHLDPDLRFDIIKRDKNWRPIFGQIDAAQTHLAKKQEIAIGDIFLFFGWFRQTNIIDGKYSYIKGSPDLHVIYGYLQIGEKYPFGKEFPDFAKHHPHAREDRRNEKSNCIYVARDKLTFDETLPGAGVLKFNDNLRLTKNGKSKSRWELRDFFKDVDISYHTKDSFKQDYFQSAAIGQEFVISANDNVLEWAKDLIVKNSLRSKN